tara:strand:+ start:614 stop:1870 length:1257 start_codon:yes stop_codon:yes gene_type:complete
MLFNILLFIVFIFLSAFFSSSETAIFSLNNVKLRKLSQKYPQAKKVKTLLKKPTRLLSAIVFGNILVNIGLTSLSTTIFVKQLGPNGLFIAIALSGLVILFLGEIFPKTLAIYMAERLSLVVTPWISIFSKAFSPLIIVIERVVNYFSSFFIKKSRKTTLSDEEFKAVLTLSKKEGQITAQEEAMIGYVLEFKDTQASEILTARIDIKGIDISSSQAQVLNFLRKEKHSKIPVYEGSLDNIVGMLYAKDVFLKSDQDYHQLLRKPIFIPESKGIDDILKLFLYNNERLAVVLDEYGGCEGLITLEDIIEEIFGEIYDEFETVEEPLEKIVNQEWKVYGKTAIKTVNAKLGLEFPEDEDTIAGFILSQIERIPKTGEEFDFTVKNSSTAKATKIHFKIQRATARRIVSLVLTILGQADK